jgi:hypothetical protein
MSFWNDERPMALAGFMIAGLLLSPVVATGASPETAAQAAKAGSPATSSSPYARYAREHAKGAERGTARVKPSTYATGREHRTSARASR